MDEKKRVRQTVEGFLQALGARDAKGAANLLTDTAHLVVLRKGDEGFKTTFHSKDDWIERISKLEEPFEEILDTAEVMIENNVLAHLRGDFRIVIGEDTVKHGVDYFTLVHQDNEWKIAAIAYTSLPGRPGE